MKLTVETPKEQGIVRFIDDKELVKIGSEYFPISYSLNDVETLYSLPSNDKHTPYTKRSNVKLNAKVKKAVNKYWTPFKDGDVINGNVIDGVFYVNRTSTSDR